MCPRALSHARISAVDETRPASQEQTAARAVRLEPKAPALRPSHASADTEQARLEAAAAEPLLHLGALALL